MALIPVDTVRASRDGHTFHERWAARRALQLVFPKDRLFAIAVEGLSTNETAAPGNEAEDIADLSLFFGNGDTFDTCDAQKTIQFKYKANPGAETCSYLKKTIQKFAATLLGYEREFKSDEIAEKLTFSFVTNTDFSDYLWDAIESLKSGSQPKNERSKEQYENLKNWCLEKGMDAERLFASTEFQASTQDLTRQNRILRQTLSSWSPGADSIALARLHGIEELIREKAGLSGQSNNIVRREEVLDALGCDSEDDLFPANTEFVEIDAVVERDALDEARAKILNSVKPVFIFADGGVGKTVFIQSLAYRMQDEFEAVIFDCFGGGSYRSEDQSRHLPKIGLLQIVNELASRGLCDPQLPTDGDADALIKAARKRLEQVATTIKTQSPKLGVLVIIDAADNAQLEADDRKEKSFPRLLLASLSREPIEGVKLVLTARPHRMGSVTGKCEVERFELGTFSKAETKDFLEHRRKHVKKLEFSTAYSRSGGNARVLEYLVDSWEENISGTTPKTMITVEELIKQRCDNIQQDLYRAGWSDSETRQFFAAISLLPPPIPLPEMASALDWSVSKVNSVVSDLAPMLEVVKHGAIFRDEPTETFIRDTYASQSGAQQEIADRLLASQNDSIYAAEALPRFLVVIGDSDRAYKLAKSHEFPTSVQSEYGRRRLRLLRMHSAFSLAVKERDYDRTLKLTMQLAQVASANAKGDQFIRQAPGVAVLLGDRDASRRLFQDRSGWRGKRDARLTVAYAFQDEMSEADIHQHRAIGWINWNCRSGSDEDSLDRSGPSAADFAAVLLLDILKGEYAAADKNIVEWNFPFALSVCTHLIALIVQYEAFTGTNVFGGLINYTARKKCLSFALQISMLASERSLDFQGQRRIARAASALAKVVGNDIFDDRYDYEQTQQNIVNQAAIAALLHNSRQSSLKIMGSIKSEQILNSDYINRHGHFRGWTPILSASLSAWSANQKIKFHHLVPHGIEVNKTLKRVNTRSELFEYLLDLKIDTRGESSSNTMEPKKRFNRSECEGIAEGIELVINLAKPLQDNVLARREIGDLDFCSFIDYWQTTLKSDDPWKSETARDTLSRNVGMGFACIFLKHASCIAEDDAKKLIDILNLERFSISDKLNALFLLVKHAELNSLSGQFAKRISEDIRQDESIEQRSAYYSRLTEALLSMSTKEAREYFRQGLSQLDQMGGDDYDIIYSLLRYADQQLGGWVKPNLGHRLMNLCQTIFHYKPSKFGWTLFGSAAAQSIGTQAIYKLVRWADQDVVELSLGLPQVACFLAKGGHLDVRRAAFLLLLCENQGWYDWRVGDGLRDLFGVARDNERRRIFTVVYDKLKFEHPSGGSDYDWNSLLKAIDGFPEVAKNSDVDDLNNLSKRSRARTDEENRHNNVHRDYQRFDKETNAENKQFKTAEAFELIIRSCNISEPHTIDEAIRITQKDQRFRYNVRKRILEHLREKCLYEQREDYIFVLGELVELAFDDTVEIMIETVEMWSESSAYISANKKAFVERFFELKGTKLFDLRFAGILQQIRNLVEFCGDDQFVQNLVLDTVAREKVELSGDEWLQLATSLCACASSEVNLEALESLLSGPAAQIGDEIGEGSYNDLFAPPAEQSNLIAELTWHLLSSAEAFVRWTTARSIKGLADLGLHSDIEALMECYDRESVEALNSNVGSTSFLNAQQWLLIGLSRACLHHGKALEYLTEHLKQLANRNDIHAVNKAQIIRCLGNISADTEPLTVSRQLWNEVYVPEKGVKVHSGWPKHVKAKSGFRFDYEFSKYRIRSLARLFKISEGEVVDALASEIQKRWPDAKDMNYFPGQERYGHSQTDRYESNRESIQRHAMFWAASSLKKTHSVYRESYESVDANPWAEWMKKFDVSFEDGSWLSDHIDAVPKEAMQRLIEKKRNEESLITAPDILRKIGLLGGATDVQVPLCGSWRSSDGVNVRMVSALAKQRGVIGICKAFSKLPDHDMWLPTFSPDGHDDEFRAKREFEPLIWEPEHHTVGIDEGDQFASRKSAIRPRLGVELSLQLGLKSDKSQKAWFTQDNGLALKSDVWGQWRSSAENHRDWYQDEGQILWASPSWLDTVLANINRCVVFHIEFCRYKNYRSYDTTKGLKAVYVALRLPDGEYRLWKSYKASKAIY